MNSHSLLITGGAGFIGSNFVQYWSNKYPYDRLVILDKLTYAGKFANLEPVKNHSGLKFVHGNIKDYDLVLSILHKYEVDTIVHFAAESHVDRSIYMPDTFIDTNIIGTHIMLKAAKAAWIGTHSPSIIPNSRYRFHHISTDEVYGSLGANDPSFSEISAYAPNSPYAASKASSDFLVRSYFKTYGLPITISNCSNNYGPYQLPEKLIPLLILNSLEGKPLPIYGDGQNIRDWLYVEDHCRGIDFILKQGRLGETYNIGGNCEKTNIEVVESVCQLMDELSPKKNLTHHASLVTLIEDRPGHDKRYAIDTTKIVSELGFSPVESFGSGIRKTVEWYLENLSWCENVIDDEYEKWMDFHYSIIRSED